MEQEKGTTRTEENKENQGFSGIKKVLQLEKHKGDKLYEAGLEKRVKNQKGVN